MTTKNQHYTDLDELPDNQVFPANTASLLVMIGIIVTTFSLSVLALFSY